MIVPLVVAISFIVLDNHFIYEWVIETEGYFLLREKVRFFKSRSGLKYQANDNSEDSRIKDRKLSIHLRMKNISAKGFLDEATLASSTGNNSLSATYDAYPNCERNK